MSRKRNRGWFQRGDGETRRHTLTKEERQRGYRAAREKIQDLYGIDAFFWFLNRVRESYTLKNKGKKR
jgi:hypothetical protein